MLKKYHLKGPRSTMLSEGTERIKEEYCVMGVKKTISTPDF